MDDNCTVNGYAVSGYTVVMREVLLYGRHAAKECRHPEDHYSTYFVRDFGYPECPTQVNIEPELPTRGKHRWNNWSVRGKVLVGCLPGRADRMISVFRVAKTRRNGWPKLERV